MSTNLAIDDRLIEEARKIGGHKTKKEAVSAALAEYIRRRDPEGEYKAEFIQGVLAAAKEKPTLQYKGKGSLLRQLK